MQTPIVSETIKVRERGQMTLPENIRRQIDWLNTGSILEIKINPLQDKLIIKPLLSNKSTANKKVFKQNNQPNWNKIKKKLKTIRTWGRQDVNLTEFLINDREKRKYE